MLRIKSIKMMVGIAMVAAALMVVPVGVSLTTQQTNVATTASMVNDPSTPTAAASVRIAVVPSVAHAAPPYVESCCINDGWIICCYVMEFMDSIGWE